MNMQNCEMWPQTAFRSLFKEVKYTENIIEQFIGKKRQIQLMCALLHIAFVILLILHIVLLFCFVYYH